MFFSIEGVKGESPRRIFPFRTIQEAVVFSMHLVNIWAKSGCLVESGTHGYCTEELLRRGYPVEIENKGDKPEDSKFWYLVIVTTESIETYDFKKKPPMPWEVE